MSLRRTKSVAILDESGHGRLVGSVSSSYLSGYEIDLCIRHILYWRLFSTAGSRRARCQLLTNKCGTK